MPRHQHPQSYLTVVLKGEYEQTSYAGRLRIRAGDVVLQPTFDCHADRMVSPGLEILRLPWRLDVGLGGVFEGLDVDLLCRSAERDLLAAASLAVALVAGGKARARRIDDRPDKLAADLVADPKLEIGRWAELERVSRESVSRTFTSLFQVTPARYRLELRARAAWARISGSGEPLSSIAAEVGFADQAHMTRAVRWLTGRPPTVWRRHGRAPKSDT